MKEEYRKNDEASAAQAGGESSAPSLPSMPGEAFRSLDVRLENYEGPLDLLLDIIRRNEMNIFDIPMIQITEQYLAYLNHMRMLDLEIAGEFLVMAATLVYIKSRMILPQEEEKAEEEGQDPREELVRKLLEYQAFKEAARTLGHLETERAKEYTRQIADYYFSHLTGEEEMIDTLSASLYDLMTAFHRVMSTISKDSFHEVFQEVISIDEKIVHIKAAFEHRPTLQFEELFSPETSRNEFIVTFLAILELVRSKFLRVVQKTRFGEISLARREPGEATEVL